MSRISEEDATSYVLSAIAAHLYPALADDVLRFLLDDVSAVLYASARHALIPTEGIIASSETFQTPYRTVRTDPGTNLNRARVWNLIGGRAGLILERIYSAFPDLAGFDISHLVLAGPAIQQITTGIIPETLELRLFGLDAGEAELKVAQLGDHLRRARRVTQRRGDRFATYTSNARKYKVRLGLFATPGECLHDFDLGSEAIGVFRAQDGVLWAQTTLLGGFAIERGANIANVGFGSPRYFERASRAVLSGFAFVLPDMCPLKGTLAARAPGAGLIDEHLRSPGTWKTTISFKPIREISYGGDALPSHLGIRNVLDARARAEPEDIQDWYARLERQIPFGDIGTITGFIDTVSIVDPRDLDYLLNSCSRVSTLRKRVNALLHRQLPETLRLAREFAIAPGHVWKRPARRVRTLEEFYGSALRKSPRVLEGANCEPGELMRELLAIE